MSSYLNIRSNRAAGPRKSGGGTLWVLVFLGASVLIAGIVIALDKRSHRSSRSGRDTPSASVGTLDAEDYYKKRGLQPNVQPKPPQPEPLPTPRPEPEPPKPTSKYVGQKEWSRYHLPDCKYALRLTDDQKVLFASAEEAVAKGYIPCKVCKPPMASGKETVTVTRPNPKPPPQEDPVSLPVTDVEVPFPFEIVDREVVPEQGVIRVEFTVEVDKPIKRDDVLLLARKIVASEIRKQQINSVSIFMRTRASSRSILKWVCMVDWAPYGNLTRANEVKTGDYRTHQFNIFDQGFFKR